MSDKMTLLVVKQTKHVLGATTLVAKSDPVVGTSGMLIRIPKQEPPPSPPKFEQLEVAAEELEAVTADLDMAVLLQPFEYVWNKDKKIAEKPPATLPITFTLDADKVAVDAGGNVTGDLDVWVQISGDNLPSPRVVVGRIVSGTRVCDMPLQTLSKGFYVVFALALGRPKKMEGADIP